MFQPGKVYKVKVETNPGETGFGRATIVERTGTQLIVQVRTSKELNAVLPKGTRIWFVNDSPNVTFNGLWASSVIGTQSKGNLTMLVCSSAKLEPLLQRRRTPRVAVDVPVQVFSVADAPLSSDARSVDISRSGIAIETMNQFPGEMEVGSHVKIVVRSTVGDIPATARVIRVENNWLANKTTAGLEYTELSAEATETLDKLLVLLGGKPRNESSESVVPGGVPDGRTQTTRSGLSAWMPAGKGDTSQSNKFVGAPSEADEGQTDEQTQ